jgi:hypothetical protein
MALGNNHGTSSHINDLVLMYKIASLVDDAEKMESAIASIGRAHYAESTKRKALRDLDKWETARLADKILGQ